MEKTQIPRKAKIPKIPQEQKINVIITKAHLKLRTSIEISKETILRPVELMRLTLKDIDLANKAVYPKTAKRESPRALKIINSTLNLINKYISNHKITLNKNLFGNWNSDNPRKKHIHKRKRKPVLGRNHDSLII